MKTQMRKGLRKSVGPTMREVLAQKKEKKNDDGITGLIVTGLAVQPPEGLHEVKAAAQATIESRMAPMAPEQSINCKQSRSNSQTISDVTKPALTPKEPIISQARVPITMSKAASISPILDALDTSTESTAVIPDKPIKKIIPSAVKNRAVSSTEPPKEQIATPFFEKSTCLPVASQIVCDSDAQASENEITIAEQAVISKQETQVVDLLAPPSSGAFTADIPQPNASVKPRQIMDDYRQIAKNQGVLIYQRVNKPLVVAKSAPFPAPVNRRELIDEIVCDYAARLSRVLSRSGRKPFRLAGLRLYADLLALLGSLEVSLTHLRDEPRLTCFADGIRQALKTYEDEYTSIAEGYSWLLDISSILDTSLPTPEIKSPEKSLSEVVQVEVNAYLKQLSKRSDLNDLLLSFRKHLLALTERYSKGLFHCYDIAGLPRTNNSIESLFGRVRRQTLLTSGPHHAKHRLHEQGAWLLFDVVTNEHQQLERLKRVSLEDWQKEQQRMSTHQATFTANRRFRRQPEKYLLELETRAAEAAQLPS